MFSTPYSCLFLGLLETHGKLVSNGWSDSQGRPLRNFMAISDSKTMFLETVDFSIKVKENILLQIC